MVLSTCALLLAALVVITERILRSTQQHDNLIELVNDLLPQTQCAQCGYLGCLPYAEAVTNGESINLCTPGGATTQRALSALLNRPFEDVILNDPRPATARIHESDCIGCGLCVEVCPVDAIIGAPNFLHTILESHCTGCELCVSPCPVDCIDLIQLPYVGGSTNYATPTP